MSPQGFFVCDPLGLVTEFETYEEAELHANREAKEAVPRGSVAAYWEVRRHPTKSRRVLYRAYAAKMPPLPPSGDGLSGVREPRRPHPSPLSGAIELPEPD